MKKKSKGKLTSKRGFRVLGENEPKRVARGKSMYGYDGLKKRMTISLTDTAREILEKACEQAGLLSRSEFIERWLRNDVAPTLGTNNPDH